MKSKNAMNAMINPDIPATEISGYYDKNLLERIRKKYLQKRERLNLHGHWASGFWVEFDCLHSLPRAIEKLTVELMHLYSAARGSKGVTWVFKMPTFDNDPLTNKFSIGWKWKIVRRRNS